MMNKKVFFFIPIFIILILYFYYASNSMDNRDQHNYEYFIKSDLRGTVIESKEYARGVKLQLENKTVVFYPMTSNLNENNIFLFTVKKGDSIIKKPFQDTLILKKKNGTFFKYTFFKFN